MTARKLKRAKRFCHSAALLLELVGLPLAYLDAKRSGEQLRAAGFVSYEGGPPPGMESWIYNSGELAFWIIGGGIGMAIIAFVLESLEERHAEKQKTLASP